MQILKNALIALTSLASVACAAAPAARKLASTKIYEFESDASGFNTKTIFVDNGEEVVAFDAQFTPALAEAALAFLHTRTSHPVRYLVITHPNPDKFNGMGVFQAAGAEVVASEATVRSLPGVQAYKQAYFVGAGMFTNDTYPRLGTVNRTFAHDLTLTLKNGDEIRLQELDHPGVSSNQTVAFVPSANALIVGDLVHENAHAWLEGGIVGGKPTPTLAGWIQDLESLPSLFPSNPTVFGGRGDAAPLIQAVADQIRYLKKADALVTAYVQGLGTKAADYAEIQKQFEAAFPEYRLPYMIGYGVYGLVNSKR